MAKDVRNVSGISRYWKKGEDDRVSIAREIGLRSDNETNRRLVDLVLSGLLRTVMKRPRTKIVGFGVFEWKKWNNRIPTGKYVETWRLAFKPGRYVKGKYDGVR